MSKLDNAPVAYTFDDFFLAPAHSEVRSRKDPNTSTELGTINLRIPVVSSPMNTVTEVNMAVTMAKLGGIGVIHRYMSPREQADMALEVISQLENTMGFPSPRSNPYFVCAVGANGDAMERAELLWSEGVRAFCIDVANGHSVHCLEAIRRIKGRFPTAHIMAGNVCTYDGAYRLAEAGANSIRVGIGPGSMCTTRVVTGHGVPQLSAIEGCARVKTQQEYGIHGDRGTQSYYKKRGFLDVSIIADGGIRSSGDIVKALAIGADAVMLGGLLAGTSDTPGETHQMDGQLYKYYHGMASEKGREGYFDRAKTAYVPEGESTRVPYKGATDKIVEGLMGGLRVGMSYAGADNLAALRQNAQWRRVTGAGAVEGTPHGK